VWSNLNLRKKTILVILLVFSLILLPKIQINGKVQPIQNFEGKDVLKNWTVMLYFCADSRDETVDKTNPNNEDNFIHTNLKSVIDNLNKDLLLGSDANVNIIVLYDYPYSTADPNGRAKILKIRPFLTYQTLADWGATNMGAEQTLDNFISYCKTNYPASNYALVLSDHGRGYAGVCYDYHAPHPYFDTLGDCLLPNEISSAIEDNSGIDVLVLDSCLGSNFELAWQLVDNVDYLVAAERSQSPKALHHPREFLWYLSRSPSMDASTFAQTVFNAAVNPNKVLNDDYKLTTCTFSNLTDFKRTLDSPQFGMTSFWEVFYDFTLSLKMEMLHDINVSRELFLNIRKELDSKHYFTTDSMLVDLYEFLDTITLHASNFTYTLIPDRAAYLRDLLYPAGDIIIDEYSSSADMNGFSICFPSIPDHYKGFLFPNLYYNLRISDDTDWDFFLYLLFKDPIYRKYFKLEYDYLEFFFDGVDPRLSMHVNYWFDPDGDPLHVGVSDLITDPPSPHMGIDIGIEGAQYFDDLIFGNSYIRIPYNNLPAAGFKNEEKILEVLINAWDAVNEIQEFRFVARNVVNNEIAWMENFTQIIEKGQLLRCEVSNNQLYGTFEPSEEPRPPTREETDGIGFRNFSFAIISPMAIIIIIAVRDIFRKKKK
jgi:hypothetical protein